MPLRQFTIPQPNDVRDGFLRTIRNALVARGVASPNVGKGSDWWFEATAVAEALSPAFANAVVKADQCMPDTATGTDLERIAGIYGLARRGTQGAGGFVVLASTATTGIATGAQLVDAKGKRFAVTVGGVYANGASVPVQGADAGADTNHAAGDTLTWVAPPPYARTTALVDAGGLSGGVDAENDDALRARLLDHLRNPPAGGNWSYVAQVAEEANGAVSKAFVYPALDGPATLGVCVVGKLRYDATLGWTRGLTAAQNVAIASYVSARMPQHANLTVRTPEDLSSSSPCVDADVSIGLSLPGALSSGGAGGGWVDAVPWPTPLGGAFNVPVLSVTSPTDITIGADSTGIVAGTTRVSWFDTSSGTVMTSTVLVVAASSPGVSTRIQIDPSAPFAGVAVGDYVFPASERGAAYGDAWMAAMARLGPGQWTTDANLLPRANRQPLTAREWPSDLTAVQLRAISDVGSEVLDVAYLYRSATTPGVPATTADSPKILVPRRLGFYPL